MMETSAESPPTVDPKWLSARKVSGARREVSVALFTSAQFSGTCAVKWDLSECW